MFEEFDDPIPPGPSPGLRETVLAEAGHRRLRRRLAGAGAAAVAVALGAAVVSGAASQHPSRVASGPASSSTSYSMPAGTDTTESPSTTVAEPGPSTTAPRAPSTTVAGGITATTRPRQPGATTTTTTAPPTCGAGDLVISTTTDAASYPAGATVTITVAERNRSDHTCTAPRAHMSERDASVVDSAGTTVWDEPFGPPGLEVPRPDPVLAPGGSYTVATVRWDQRTCQAECASSRGGMAQEGNPVPPGTYTAVGHVYAPDGRADGSSPPFTIRAAA
jgi:hypothetical protein